MILAGPEVPEGLVCHEPVSLVDCFPTAVECVGAPPHPDDHDLPGASLFDLARGTAPRRTILSEYHAAGATTGAFMIRKGPFKYVHYAGMPPQLFDVDTDPQEARDLAGSQATRVSSPIARRRCAASSTPTTPTRWPRPTSGARIAAMGGREAIIARGSFGYSPTPGTKPVYN